MDVVCKVVSTQNFVSIRTDQSQGGLYGPYFSPQNLSFECNLTSPLAKTPRAKKRMPKFSHPKAAMYHESLGSTTKIHITRSEKEKLTLIHPVVKHHLVQTKLYKDSRMPYDWAHLTTLHAQKLR